MIDQSEIEDLTRQVAGLNGLDLETAARVVWAVGDTPQMTQDGLILARLSDGRELKVQWPADEGE